MSTAEHRRADMVAGFLCAFSFTMSAIALTRDPALFASTAIVLALVAARMTMRHQTLAAAAVVISTLAFVGGMVIAIATKNPVL